MDDDSSDGDLMQPALIIDGDGIGDEFNLDIPPTSGSEYLKRVRQEAKDCPKVVVAQVDQAGFRQTVLLNQVTSCLPAPKGFSFDLAWQRTQIANFAELRQNLARQKALRKKQPLIEQKNLPAGNDVEGWCRLCFGRLQPPGSRPQEVVPEEVEDQTHKGTLPFLSIVMAMDQSVLVKVLEYHVNWFEATGFTERQGCWFYALLAWLQKPLIPEACSLLRSLARGAANLRATLDSVDNPHLVPLNLFICLVSRYFDQSDLADTGS
ncbi:gem-associated protein 2-like [Mizuhopecten yessoensis]|uniref:Gem-associated protein 2 n=1 Tax=Mizuhopecten yessoensis TaxID=6573 RepID=A0A210R3I5_MIZYE|nr:gem-associated protein 2-like [Mizuhopecten yessoensis]OWF55474.1 Gem-associated protein 2 [Mizuhopecten yessoensis]